MRHQIFIYSLIIIVISTISMSCKNATSNTVSGLQNKDSTIVPGDTVKAIPKYIMPLNPGNAWLFRTIEFNSSGDTLRKDVVTELRITSDTLINGIKWMKTESNNGYIISRLYRNDSMGLIIGGLSGNISQVYPYPAQINSVILLWKVAAVDTIINTSIGDMKCYLYQMRSNEVPIVRQMFSPQFGPIYLEFVNQTIKGTTYISEKLWIKSAIIN